MAVAAGEKPLAGRVALVAGATRGASRAMAVELGRAGAVVYATGRTTRRRVSEVGRPTETIEETAELVGAAGGEGIAVPTDHLVPEQVRSLMGRIESTHGRLDVLVNGLWGGEHLVGFGERVWETDLDAGLRMIRLGIEAHLVTSRLATPLMIREPGSLLIEVTDGTAESNAHYRQHVFYDLVKYAPIRMAFALGEELREKGGTAVALTPGFLRSEAVLEHFGVTEDTWRDAIARDPYLAISESPRYVARAVVALAADPDVARFNGRSLSSGHLAREVYGFTDDDGSRPDGLGYIEAAYYQGRKVAVGDYR